MVLLIEDDLGLADLVSEILQDLNDEVYSTDSFIKAEEFITNNKIELMIVDYKIYNENALDWIKNLFSRHTHIPPFIISTGQGDERIATEMMKLGARDYVIKDGQYLDKLPDVIKRVKSNIDNENKLKTTVAALAESENRLNMVMEATSDGYWDWNLATDTIYWSPRAFEMLGYSPGEFILNLNKWKELVHPDDLTKAWEQVEKKLNKDEGGFIIEFRYKTKSGDWKWIMGRGKTVEYDKNGNPLRMVGTHTDLTERKLAEIEKEKMLVEISQKQKMESVGRLAGGIAHDFNNMLGVIMGHTELAMIKTFGSPELHNHLKEVYKAVEHSADLTRQLLTFARKQIINPQIIDVNERIENVLKMIRRLIGENVNLTFVASGNNLQVMIDPTQFDQIFINLCINAKDAIENKGNIKIQTVVCNIKKEEFDRSTEIYSEEYIKISVTDNGFGIPSEIRDKIFEPFFTTKSKEKGTGLGLATVYGIVKQNNGLINFKSEQNVGTTFNVYFPLLKQKTTENKNSEYNSDFPGGTESILLVEDNVELRGMIKQMLLQLGYNVIDSTDPRDAITKIKTSSNKINLLLTDVVMPDINGKELAEMIKKLNPEIKIIYMSGYISNIITLENSDVSLNNYIQKPFTISDLASKIRSVMDNN